MTILHTKFLVHWTGKDFHKPLTNPLDDRIRKHYVDRLADVLRNGFLMQILTRIKEKCLREHIKSLLLCNGKGK